MKDITGEKIGQLTIIGPSKEKGKLKWKYVCSCGNTGEVLDYNLKVGIKLKRPCSCGCQRGVGNHRLSRDGVIGQRFHRLVVDDFVESRQKAVVRCICDCGNKVECTLNNLRKGNTKSCGCWQKEMASISGCEHSKNAMRRRIKWFHHKDGKKIMMRSCYEIMFAEILDRRGLYWKYEPKTIKLKDGMRYKPDFYIPKNNEWFEVKGYITEAAKEKIDEFIRQGNKLTVILLDDIERESKISYRLFRKEWVAKNGRDG